jgi:hypothetical protein
VWLTSAEPVENWPLQAPRIAGALPGTDAEMVKLLTTGIWKTGTYLRAPMPQFRMKPRGCRIRSCIPEIGNAGSEMKSSVRAEPIR